MKRTHYCGAYWRWGFHEDGVASAHRAIARMRRRWPRPRPHTHRARCRQERARGLNALYEGWVGHRRVRPVEHRFRYRVFMAYLDLDAVPERVGPAWLWSTSHPALVRFRRADYLGDPDVPLADAVRALVPSAPARGRAGPCGC